MGPCLFAQLALILDAFALTPRASLLEKTGSSSESVGKEGWISAKLLR